MNNKRIIAIVPRSPSLCADVQSAANRRGLVVAIVGNVICLVRHLRLVSDSSDSKRNIFREVA